MSKRFNKKIFTKFRIFIIICLVFLIIFITGLIKELFNRFQIDNQIRSLEQEITELDKENMEINSLINTWSTGSQLERQARLKLGLQKSNEKVVLIRRDENENDNNQSVIGPDSERIGNIISPKDKVNDTPNPIKWWRYFFASKIVENSNL